MNAQETRESAVVMLAWTNGKKVQVRKHGDVGWKDIPHHSKIHYPGPLWDWDDYEYRVAPENLTFVEIADILDVDKL